MSRSDMVGSEMAKIIYANIKKIKDQNCTEMTSVIEVTVTKDLKYAKVILSIFSLDEEKRMNTFKAICRAGSFLKHALAKEMRIRTVPTLTFDLDRSSEYSAKINTILEKLVIPKEEKEENED